MIASTHLAVGAVSALFVQRHIPARYDINVRYVFSFVAGILSHIVLDSIPHSEYGFGGQAQMPRLVVESLIMSAILLFGQKNSVMQLMIVLGMIGGALPDGLYFANNYTGWNWLFLFHNFLHITHGMLPYLYASYFIQILIAVSAAFYVRIKSA